MPDLILPQAPAVIIPKSFSLKNHTQEDRERLRDEIMDKESAWENDMSSFFQSYAESAQSWRVKPMNPNVRKSRGFSNSKSGETHRATETLATIFFRMLTSNDSYFQLVGRGLDAMGQRISENQIYGAEQVIITQQRKLRHKGEMLTSLRSLSLFGTVIFELPWIRMLNPDGATFFEGTGMQLRSLLTTGFDTTVYDINESDFIFTVDYLTKWRIRNLMLSDPEGWDREAIENVLKNDTFASGNGEKSHTNVFARLTERKQKAGYNMLNRNIHELISYHGRLDTENPIIADYWQSMGFQGDPKNYDFTAEVLDGDPIVKFHVTQYGNWRTKFKTAHYKRFELEPIGYGVGSIGARTQKDIDISLSRASDTLLMALYGIYKLGRYAGLKPDQLQIRPHQILEMDDVKQLEVLGIDLNAVAQAVNFQGILREEFRANTGATSNLQAVNTSATATESSLTQAEAIRASGVHAEIIGETFVRETIEQMHINNLDNLDEPIWVDISGEQKPRGINKYDLPRSIGVEIKITTDKDFRPERVTKILEGMKIYSSIRNEFPNSYSALVPLSEEYFRSIGLNPRLLNRPMSVKDEMMFQLQKQAKMNSNPMLAMEDAGQNAGDAAGGGANVSTPVGPVPTSPLGSFATTGGPT